MARPESIIRAGFYPTPEHLLPAIAGLVRPTPRWQSDPVTILDPCAGEGVALRALASAWRCYGDARAIELEAGRHAALARHLHHRALHGDTFRAVVEGPGAAVLYLNPPYDVDRDHGRLEERFLARTLGWLAVGGALVFVVPHHALAASAATLARHFEELSCFRFPVADFAAYRQIVLVARRRGALPYPDPMVAERVHGWANDPESAPELPPVDEAPVLLPVKVQSGFARFVMAEIDLPGLLASCAPWTATVRGGARLERAVSPEPDEHLQVRTYPMASTPRAAHLAAALAAGVFNGAAVQPNDGQGPALLVKGTFSREWRKVDEKLNKDGEVVAHVEVQAPQLVTTVLDLSTGTVHTLRASGDVTGATDPGAMTTADLLDRYGVGLMRAMMRACPVVEPEPLELPRLSRALYPAQADTVRTVAHLLRHGDAAGGLPTGAIVQGEVGTGKTTVALATLATIGARNPLVLVPPHLVSTWAEQARAVLPSVDVRVLESVSDVADLPRGTAERPVLAILSRETAKLGHAYEAIGGTACPGCGGPIEERDHAKTRARCQHAARVPTNAAARVLLELVDVLAPAVPHDPHVQAHYPRTAHRARALEVLRKRPAGRAAPAALWGILRGLAARALSKLVRVVAAGRLSYRGYPGAWKEEDYAALEAAGFDLGADREESAKAIRAGYNGARKTALVRLLDALAWALPELADAVCGALRADPYLGGYGPDSETYRDLLVLSPGTPEELVARIPTHWQGGYEVWTARRELIRRVQTCAPDPRDTIRGTPAGVLRWGILSGSAEAAAKVLDVLAEQSAWSWGRTCDTPLYCAVPKPRRFPLATWIVHRAPRSFDALVIDEGHEYSGQGSAQQVAAERLSTLRLPTLLLSGTLSNGYARSLFANLHALSERFRRSYGRDDVTRFVDRFGYLKRTVQQVDGKGKVVAFGSQSDRVQRQERAAGQAPGVLPLLQLLWLGPVAVTLQLADLGVDLPPCELLPVEIQPGRDLERAATALKATVTDQIKRDRFQPDRAGKLWGAMAHLPLYTDLCAADVGNTGDPGARAYEVRYPESVGGELVATGDLFPADELLPKEAWIVERVRAELAEDRPVMVYAHSVELVPRLARLLREHIGEEVAVLDAKVGTQERDAWIRAKVVAKRIRVLVVNPVCVQTGLNSLVYFPTIVWAQNPDCNPTVYAQANGRIHRIGQTRPCRVYFPMYAGLQVAAHKLLLHKVGVVRAVDGLDPEAALRAAGIIEEGYTGFSVGRALYELIERGAA